MKSTKRHAAALAAILVLACLFLSACDASTETIRLRGNKPNGHFWDYDVVGDDVVVEVDREYIDGNIPGTEDAPGIFVFRFNGQKEGNAKLYFYYMDEGKDENEYLSAIIYDVAVDQDGKITECRPVGATFENVDEIPASEIEAFRNELKNNALKQQDA